MSKPDLNPFLFLALALLFLAIPFSTPAPAGAAPLLEYCEHSAADHQLRAARGTAGCVPLVEKKDPSTSDDRTAGESTRQLKTENLSRKSRPFYRGTINSSNAAGPIWRNFDRSRNSGMTSTTC